MIYYIVLGGMENEFRIIDTVIVEREIVYEGQNTTSSRGSRGRDRMIVGLITTYEISADHH